MSSPREPRCQVCTHDDRGAIEQAILNGKPHREVARQFGIGSRRGTPDFRPDHKIIGRHIDTHMAAAYQQAMAKSIEDTGNALVARMDHLDQVVDETLARLRAGTPVRDENGPMLDDDGKPIVRYDEGRILAAVREARRNVDMRARLAGIMPEDDPAAVEAARRALESPAARQAIAEAERILAQETARHSAERG